MQLRILPYNNFKRSYLLLHCSKSTSNSTKSKESKESDREKQNGKENDKTKNHEKAEKSKRPSPIVVDSPRDEYDKGRCLS